MNEACRPTTINGTKRVAETRRRIESRKSLFILFGQLKQNGTIIMEMSIGRYNRDELYVKSLRPYSRSPVHSRCTRIAHNVLSTILGTDHRLFMHSFCSRPKIHGNIYNPVTWYREYFFTILDFVAYFIKSSPRDSFSLTADPEIGASLFYSNIKTFLDVLSPLQQKCLIKRKYFGSLPPQFTKNMKTLCKMYRQTNDLSLVLKQQHVSSNYMLFATYDKCQGKRMRFRAPTSS